MCENKETVDTKTEEDDSLSQAIIARQKAAQVAFKAYIEAQITISHLEAWVYREIKDFLCERADMEVTHSIRSNKGPSKSSHQTPQAPIERLMRSIERLARLHQKKQECADLSSARMERFFASQ